MYRAVFIYDEDVKFIGQTIKGDDKQKLQTTNIYVEGEENELLGAINHLNENENLTRFWPNARDPLVIRLLEDPDFEPVEMGPVEVVDEDKSNYVYQLKPEIDTFGMPTGEMIEGDLDRMASTIIMKTIMAPVRPSDVMARTKKAQQIVAAKRSSDANVI